MPDLNAAPSDTPRPSVFLSYASEDRAAARRLRDSLPAYGLEVWYDENELGGGEAWDQKIRRQIRECDYFMPVISAQTNRRNEGYFRREWRLAVERTLDMADDHLFLLPVVIDESEQATARVPEKFLTVQWLRVPDGQATAALEAMCRRLVAGGTPVPGAAPPAAEGVRPVRFAATPGGLVFPVVHDGQQVKFWVDVAGWFLRSAWAHFKRLPKWIRLFAYVWVFAAFVARCDNSPNRPRHADPTISSADLAKLKAMSKRYAAAGALDKADALKMAADFAKQFGEDAEDGADGAPAASPLLAVAFTAPKGDAAATKLADAAFAMAYGRAALAHHGLVGLTNEPAASGDLAAAVHFGQKEQAKFVLFGHVEGAGAAQMLRVSIAATADGSVIWSKSYGLGSDPATIGADINANLPALTGG